MTLKRSIDVDPEIIRNTPCDINYACLSGGMCNAEAFVERDVELLLCRDTRACGYKKKFMDRAICTCPVNVAAHYRN